MNLYLNLPKVSTKTVLLDTGAILSLLDSRDSKHFEAKSLLQKIKSQKLNLLITNTTIFEAYTRILYDIHWQKAIEFLDDISSSNIIKERVNEIDEREAEKMLRKYKNTEISFVDALNFAVMLRLKFLYVFTFDKDFLTVGFIPFS
ncbi:MAG: PIN domain-containing protein [Patescibacteria group bacterium]